MLVREVMSSPALTVPADESVKDALIVMDQHRVTSLPVVGTTGVIVGIVSEADLLRARVPHDARTHMRLPMPHERLPLRVAQVMSRPIMVEPGDDLSEAVELMTTTMVKSLPVVDQGRVVGMLSRSDVVHLMARSDEQIHEEIVDLLAGAGLCCHVEVRDGSVSVLRLDDPRSARAARAIASAVPGVVSVQVFT